MFWGRMRGLLSKDKSKEELEKHYDGMNLEKKDFPAMVIAAIITFLPVSIIAMVVIYGLFWLFVNWGA